MKRRVGMAAFAGLIRIATVLLLWNAAASADMRMAINPTKLHLSLEPGARHTETVEVSNTGDSPIRVITYVLDWTTPRAGGMVFATPGEIERSASAWVEADLSEFILPPHDSRIVRLSASLPDTANGSYWTLVFFEGEGERRPHSLGVGTKARMGTTIYLTAAETEEREDAITGMAIQRSAASDTLQLFSSVANRGNVHYYPAGWYQVLDEGGQVLFEKELPLRVLLPGKETAYRIPWLPESTGPRRFVVTLDSGLETLMQGTKRFEVPASPARQPKRTPKAEPVTIPERAIARAAPISTSVGSPSTPAPIRTTPAIRATPPAPTSAGAAPVIHATPPVADGPGNSAKLFGLHVGSFKTAEGVAVAKRRYLGLSCPIAVKTVDLAGKGTWHRLILGRFDNPTAAQEFTRELTQAFDPDYVAVVEIDP